MILDLDAFQLSTARVLVRPITAADCDALYEVYSDPEVMRYTSDPPFTDRADGAVSCERSTRLAQRRVL